MEVSNHSARAVNRAAVIRISQEENPQAPAIERKNPVIVLQQPQAILGELARKPLSANAFSSHGARQPSVNLCQPGTSQSEPSSTPPWQEARLTAHQSTNKHFVQRHAEEAHR